ncbi:MAG: Hsp20/alpha crystallin family protein [Acidobacteriota bacterium]|nr:Hsp20/alpha crystallin family protein [Acidobacteriota bacterium]
MKTGTRRCAPRGVVVIDPFNIRRSGGKKMAHRYNDWRDWRDYAERMARLYDEAAPRRARYGEEHESDLEERADWTPASDVVEREDEFLVLIDLPGIDRSALDVSISDDRLVVRGERAAEDDAQKRRGNRPSGSFLARFGPLPQSVDQSRVGAEYRDGVLRLHLPKRAPEQAGRLKIEIK